MRCTRAGSVELWDLEAEGLGLGGADVSIERSAEDDGVVLVRAGVSGLNAVVRTNFAIDAWGIGAQH